MQRRFRVVTRGSLKRLTVLLILLGAALLWCSYTMLRMPGKSFQGELPALSDQQVRLAAELKRDVETLAIEIGPRNVFTPKGLEASVNYLEDALIKTGLTVARQSYQVMGETCTNLEVQLTGRAKPNEIIAVGAHFDSEADSNTPAANDNASGVAATLALARKMAEGAAAQPHQRTIRFVLFVNEEPPFFQTNDMGSLVYAKACRERNENIVAMLSLETIGYYSEQPASQNYPITPIGWLYPDTGNFIAFVGNYDSRGLVKSSIASFRKHAQFPSEGAALPGWITGVGWSDHWAFWQHGYPALMVTDTALFRYPYYHSTKDTPEKLDYQRMARVVEGLQNVIADLADE
jgi:Zn-dependent M28 family amino/carboxypeptidase